MSIPFSTNANILNQVTVSATGDPYDVSKRQLRSIQFTASGISSGNGVFVVDVSNDGSNWTRYNRLTSNVANTNAQTDLRVASVTLNANTTAMYFFPAGDYFRMIRAGVVVTTDGTYTATLEAGG